MTEQSTTINPLVPSTFDYPGLNELAIYLAEVLAMQQAEGWHTFSMNIKASADGQKIAVDNVALIDTSPEYREPDEDLYHEMPNNGCG